MKNKKYHILRTTQKKMVFFLGFLIFQLIFYHFLKKNNWFSNQLYPKFYENFATFYAYIFQWMPFSMGDILYFLLGLLLSYIFMTLIYSALKKDWKKVTKSAIHFLLIANIFVFSFHWFWGFNYAKEPLIKKMNTKNIELNELELYTVYHLKKAIELRENLSETHEGVFYINQKDEEIMNALLQVTPQLNAIKEIINLPEFKQSSLKPSLFSYILDYIGILGYYNPFTAEAQYNSHISSLKKPPTFAHEFGHKLGFASESEANFCGFYLSLNSTNKAYQYTAHYRAIMTLLHAIYQQNPEFVDQTLSKFSEKMRNDRNYEIQQSEKYSGVANDAFSEMNNSYLKANNQDGLNSYSQFVLLLCAWHRSKKPIN